MGLRRRFIALTYDRQLAKVEQAGAHLHLPFAKSLGMEKTVHRSHRLQQRSPHHIQILHRLGEARLIAELALEHLDHEKDAVESPAQVVREERKIFALGFGRGLKLARLVRRKRNDGPANAHIQPDIQSIDLFDGHFPS